MGRYRVTTTRTEVHIVDAPTHTAAHSLAITLAEERVRPAYALGSTAEVEFYADSAVDCRAGRHQYRVTSLGADGETPAYRCEDCGSTDPEGDSAR